MTRAVTEPQHTPQLSIILGDGAMLPLAACALTAWLLPSIRQLTLGFAVGERNPHLPRRGAPGLELSHPRRAHQGADRDHVLAVRAGLAGPAQSLDARRPRAPAYRLPGGLAWLGSISSPARRTHSAFRYPETRASPSFWTRRNPIVPANATEVAGYVNSTHPRYSRIQARGDFSYDMSGFKALTGIDLSNLSVSQAELSVSVNGV
jgi:hypothetical protein